MSVDVSLIRVSRELRDVIRGGLKLAKKYLFELQALRNNDYSESLAKGLQQHISKATSALASFEQDEYKDCDRLHKSGTQLQAYLMMLDERKTKGII